VLLVVGRVLSLLVDEVIVVSRHLGEALPRRDFHVIPGSINLTLFQPIDQAEARARLGLHPTRRLALFAALNPANPRKRFGLAQAAMAIIQKHMDAELVVATGVSSEMMPVYMSACDALLLTSAHEGSTNVLKEALACNLPVVSTRVGDSHERLDGLPGCAVCDEAEPEVIAAALLRTFQMEGRPDLRASVLDLDDRLLAGKIVQVYRQALARRPPAQRAVLHEERP
jgi:glycosyltransferase involved in cell wall biosynthesis